MASGDLRSNSSTLRLDGRGILGKRVFLGSTSDFILVNPNQSPRGISEQKRQSNTILTKEVRKTQEEQMC
jgi:hypothetical protein